MIGLVLAGVSLGFIGGMYFAGVAEARAELRRRGQWVEPPRPLPPARVLSRRS